MQIIRIPKEIRQLAIENCAVGLNAAWIEIEDLSNILFATKVKSKSKRKGTKLRSLDNDLNFSEKELRYVFSIGKNTFKCNQT